MEVQQRLSTQCQQRVMQPSRIRREREGERKGEGGEERRGEAEELGECPSEECVSGGTQMRMEGEGGGCQDRV